MLQNCTIWKVAGVFFDEPAKEHYLIEISRKVKKSHTSVKQHLETLKKIGIIKETTEKKGKRKFPIYKADLEKKKYRYYKKIHNLEKIKNLTDFLNDTLMPKNIILFGSYSRGEDTEDSDIDLSLECEKQEINLNKFEKELNRKIQLHFKSNFRDYPKELKNNIINGIVLQGYLEGFK